MLNYQLNLIRQYCDTTGIRLSSAEKDLLCKVLENPARYNGFTSRLHIENNSGRDYKGTWESTTEHQYRIKISSTLSIYERYRHSCDDGYVEDRHWEWKNAYCITNTKEIIAVLKKIENEL